MYYQKNRRRFGYSGNNNRFRSRSYDPSHIVTNSPIITKQPFVPKHSFADFDVNTKIKENIASLGFTSPTAIQDMAIPEILGGKDVVGIANTGTGKTAAFLVPLIDKVVKDPRQKVLIIAPTRELALQIENELMKLSKSLNIFSAVCIGGTSIKLQIIKLKKRPQFVIGTPGRLLDLINQRKLYPNDYSNVVLDEVDRMLDMGFIKDMQKIIFKLPAKRQSLFFSATVGESVVGVMKQFTQNPIKIEIETQHPSSNVNQDIVKIGKRDKNDVLYALLDKKEFQKVLVFGRTKRGADKLTKDLMKKGFLVSSIHGNKSQSQRQRSLEAFKNGRVNILIATDVVARGIDVKDITHVINYDLPESQDDYLHRIGRTGRAGKKGHAITFVS